MVGLACGEPTSPDAAPPGDAAGRDAPAPPTEAPLPPPPPLPRPTDPAAFVGQHVLVPDGATLHLGPELGAATVTLRLPPAAGERAPTPAVAMRVVAHEGGRVKLQSAATELGCVPPLLALAGLDVAVWVEPAALARVLGRAVEARFADGTSVRLRPGVLVGPPGERVEVSADGLRLAVPIAEGDVSTLYTAEPAPPVPTGLRKLESGPPLSYASGDPVLPEASLVGGGLVLAQRSEGDRTLVRVASRCAEVEAVVDPVRLAARALAAAGGAGAAAEPVDGKAARSTAETDEPPPKGGVGLRKKGAEGTLGGPTTGRYVIRGPYGELPPGGTWSVEPGKPLTWPSGTAAGTTSAAHSFEVEPTAQGDRLCFAVAPSEAAVAEGETLPLCLLAADLTRHENPLSLAASAGILGMLATSESSGHFLASPYGTAFDVPNDDEEVFGALMGELGEPGDMGSVALAGTGRGGGGTGEGTIGLGTLGTSPTGTPEPAAPSGTVSLGAVEGSGIEAVDAEKVVARSRNQLRYCYEKQLAADPTLTGMLVLSLAIEGGTVTKATATSEALPEDLVRCVERSAKRWRFAGSGSVAVPVTLTPGE